MGWVIAREDTCVGAEDPPFESDSPDPGAVKRDLQAPRLRRLRWRMRGAWLWPTFVALTAVDGLVLLELPFYDAAPEDLYGTLLVAGFANLIAVALGAPLAARWLRRRRADLPREIARNYTGTALVCAVTVAFLAGGFAHRPAVRAAELALAQQSIAVREYVISQEPAYHSGLAEADYLRIDEDLFRTCVPGPDPRRPLCLLVSTDQHPAGVTRDPDRTPNSAYRVHGGFD
jgi:hypothetical protein